MSLPLRYHLALILVGLNIIGTGVVAALAYRTSRGSLESQARLAVGSVAEERQQAMMRLLERRQERLNAVLASLAALCDERVTRRSRLALERECVRVALAGLRTAERATAAELRFGIRRIAAGGSWKQPVDSPLDGTLASMTTIDGRSEYTMRAKRGRLVIRARFSLADLEPIFQDRSGLREN